MKVHNDLKELLTEYDKFQFKPGVSNFKSQQRKHDAFLSVNSLALGKPEPF